MNKLDSNDDDEAPPHAAYPQEEECASWQNHPLGVGLDQLPVLVPFDDGLGIPLGHAVERDWLVPWHDHVQRVLCYPGQFKTCNENGERRSN